jgi:hypothetical protein
MSSLVEVQEQNRELADRISEEARNDPRSPYAGKFVGLVNGQVAVVTEDLPFLLRRLREIELDPRRVFLIDPNHDPTKVEYIWGS